MKEIIIIGIRGNDIRELEKIGCQYLGYTSSYGDAAFSVKEKSVSLVKKLYPDRIRKIK